MFIYNYDVIYIYWINYLPIVGRSIKGIEEVLKFFTNEEEKENITIETARKMAAAILEEKIIEEYNKEELAQIIMEYNLRFNENPKHLSESDLTKLEKTDTKRLAMYLIEESVKRGGKEPESDSEDESEDNEDSGFVSNDSNNQSITSSKDHSNDNEIINNISNMNVDNMKATSSFVSCP